MASVSFTKTQRGSTKLVHDGYSYNVIRYGNNGRTYWRCDETRLQCKGSVATDKDNKVDIGKLHNHAPSAARVRVKMVKTYIREAALNKNVSSRNVIDSAVAGVSNSVRQSLPGLRTLQKTVTRKRKLMEEREAESKPTSSTKTTSKQTKASCCAVSGCKNGETQGNKSLGIQRSLFAVPKNPYMRKKWCESLGQGLFDDDQICELHFEKNDIVTFRMRVASDDTIHLRINGEPTLAEGAIPVRKGNIAQQTTMKTTIELDEDSINVDDDWNKTLINPSSPSSIKLPNCSEIKIDPAENSNNTDGGISYLVVIEDDSSSDECFPEHNYSMNQTTFDQESNFKQTVSSESVEEERKAPETMNLKPESTRLKSAMGNVKPEKVNLKPESMNPKPETRNLKPETRNPEPENGNPKYEIMDSEDCTIDTIKNFVRNNPLPKTWAWTDCNYSTGIVLTQISNKTKKVRCHLECNKDLSVQAFTSDNLQIKDINTTVKSIEELLQLLELATTLYLCEGIKGGKKRADDCAIVIPVREQFKKKVLFNRCTACRAYLKLLIRNQLARQKNKRAGCLASKDD